MNLLFRIALAAAPQRAHPERIVRLQRGGATLAVIGALAAAGALTSAVIWAMHLTASSAGVPAYSKAVTASVAPADAGDRQALAQLFGASAFVSTANSRDLEGVQLQGIVGDQRGAGVALFSVDGAAPVRVRVGGVVREGVKLLEIQRQQVLLERGGKTFDVALVKRPSAQNSPPDPRLRPAQATGAPGSPAALSAPPASTPASKD